MPFAAFEPSGRFVVAAQQAFGEAITLGIRSSGGSLTWTTVTAVGDLSGLAFGQHSSREACRLIVHPKASQTLVLHPVLDGPLAGHQSVDVGFSDCLRWVRPVERSGWLEPSRVLAETHVMRPDGKKRKTPGFTTWAGVVFRALRQAFPKSGVDFIHVAPGAQAWVESGQGQLGYLYQPVALRPAPATVVTTPQKR